MENKKSHFGIFYLERKIEAYNSGIDRNVIMERWLMHEELEEMKKYTMISFKDVHKNVSLFFVYCL